MKTPKFLTSVFGDTMEKQDVILVACGVVLVFAVLAMIFG